MDELVTKNPGLHGGQVCFPSDAGSFTAPSTVSLQIFGSIHLYMSWVCDTHDMNTWKKPPVALRHPHSQPDYSYLKRNNSCARWLLASEISPCVHLRWTCCLHTHIMSFSTVPSPRSHRECGCRSSRWLYTQVSVCSSLNQPLEKQEPSQGKTSGGEEGKHTAHVKIQW